MAENPPAFPVVIGETTWEGMTLRDYFAASALPGLMGRNWGHVGDDAAIILAWAASAYTVADAMLKEREK